MGRPASLHNKTIYIPVPVDFPQSQFLAREKLTKSSKSTVSERKRYPAKKVLQLSTTIKVEMKHFFSRRKEKKGPFIFCYYT